MVVQITGGASVEHNGDYFTLTTSDPITPDVTAVNFSVASSYTSSPKSELLTSAQVISEGSLGELEVATVPAASMFEPNGFQLGPTFTTLPLGLTSIPPGRFGAQMLLRNSVFTTTFVKVLWWIKHLDGSTTALAPFLTMETSTTVPYDSLYYFEADLAAPVSLVPTDCVQVAAFTHAPSIDISMGQNVTWTFQNPSRDSWFTVTWQGAVIGGTNDHQQLVNRNTVNNHYGVGTCTTSSGVIPTPTKSKMVVTVSGSTTLTEMGTSGLEDGVEIELVFLQACAILNGATPASGNAPFVLMSIDGTPVTSIDWTEPATALGRIGVTFYKTALPSSPCFLLTKGPII
jgi:hypothetical protein